MRIIFYFFLMVALAFVIDQLGLYLERKGLLYYRKIKPKKGIIGSALQELNAQLAPSHRHALVAKQEQIVRKKEEKRSSS